MLLPSQPQDGTLHIPPCCPSPPEDGTNSPMLLLSSEVDELGKVK